MILWSPEITLTSIQHPLCWAPAWSPPRVLGPRLGIPFPEVGGGVTVTQLVTPPSTYCMLGWSWPPDNYRDCHKSEISISAITRRNEQQPTVRFPEKGGQRRVAKMMEEIDRFQVPSAVQEAEMQAEMQPLVRHRDNQIYGLVFTYKYQYYHSGTLGIWGLPFMVLCFGIPTNPSLAKRNIGWCADIAFSASFFPTTLRC